MIEIVDGKGHFLCFPQLPDIFGQVRAWSESIPQPRPFAYAAGVPQATG